MKRSLLLATALCGACLCRAEVIRFDNAAVGAAPAGWTVAMTHTGGAAKWEIRNDDSAPSKPNVIAQVSTDRTAGRFPLAIWDRASVKDGAVSVKFKAISGSVDQGAGLVWRYRDPNNYYIVRANALEDNVVLYKVQNGERVSLAPKGAVSNAYGVKHKVPKQKWTTLSVSFHGAFFTVSLDGEDLFNVEDSTFLGAGKTGLWTKSDSVIYFDDFQVEPESLSVASHTIVFVCEHGSAKSMIAAAHFNQMAKEKGLPYHAVSRGVHPDEEIPAKIKNGLTRDGLDISGLKPQAVGEEDVRKADRVVTFACTLPVKNSSATAKLTEWNDIPEGVAYEVARKAIVDHVAELVKSLDRK